MQSVVNSGLKQKILEYYKKEIIQTYGFEHLVTMTILENAGLIKLQVIINYTKKINFKYNFLIILSSNIIIVI